MGVDPKWYTFDPPEDEEVPPAPAHSIGRQRSYLGVEEPALPDYSDPEGGFPGEGAPGEEERPFERRLETAVSKETREEEAAEKKRRQERILRGDDPNANWVWGLPDEQVEEIRKNREESEAFAEAIEDIQAVRGSLVAHPDIQDPELVAQMHKDPVPVPKGGFKPPKPGEDAPEEDYPLSDEAAKERSEQESEENQEVRVRLEKGPHPGEKYSEDIEYYLQPEAPGNFLPIGPEVEGGPDRDVDAMVETLLKQGLIDEEQVRDVTDEQRRQNLWEVYRNVQLQMHEGRAAHQFRQEKMHQDMQSGITPLVDKVFAEMPLKVLAGTDAKGINYIELRTRIEDAVLENFQRRFGDSEQVRMQAREKANTEYLRVLNSNRGIVFFLDPDGNDITEDSATSAKIMAMFSAMATPVAYGTGEMLTNKRTLESEGFLSHFGRVAGPIGTIWAAKMESGKGMLHPDTIQAVQHGASITHHRETIGDWVVSGTTGDLEAYEQRTREMAMMLRERGVPEDDVIEWVETAMGRREWAVNSAGAVGLTAAVLLEPDLIGTALTVPGAALRMGKVGRVAGRQFGKLEKGAKKTEDIVRRLREESFSWREAIKEIDQTDPILAAMLRRVAENEAGLGEDVAKHLDRAAKKGKAKLVEAERLQKEAAQAADETERARLIKESLEAEEEALKGTVEALERAALVQREKLALSLEGRGTGWEGALDADVFATPKGLSKLDPTKKSDSAKRIDTLLTAQERAVRARVREILGFDWDPGDMLMEAYHKQAAKGPRVLTEAGKRLVEAEKGRIASWAKEEKVLSGMTFRTVPDLNADIIARGTYFENIQGHTGHVHRIGADGRTGHVWVELENHLGQNTGRIWMDFEGTPLKLSRRDAATLQKAAQKTDTAELLARKKRNKQTAAAKRRGEPPPGDELEALNAQRLALQELRKNLVGGRGRKQINATAAAYGRRLQEVKRARSELENFRKTKLRKRVPKGEPKQEMAKAQTVLKKAAKREKEAEGALEISEQSLHIQRKVADALTNHAKGMRRMAAEIRHKYGGLKGAMKASEDDLAYFGTRVDERLVNDFVSRVTKAGIKFEGGENAVINVDKLKYAIAREMAQAFRKGKHGVRATSGKQLLTPLTDAEREIIGKSLDEFLETPAGAPLKELYDIPLSEGLTTLAQKEMAISDELPLLQNSLENLVRAAEGRRIYDGKDAFSRALLTSWRDIGFRKNDMLGHFGSAAKRLVRQFDNPSQRWGEMAPDIHQAAKATENGIALFNNELLEYTAELGTEISIAVPRFLDYDGILKTAVSGKPLKSGPVKWGVMTGDGTPYQKCRRFILTDKRTAPDKVAAKKDLLNAQRDRLLGDVDKSFRRTDPETGAKKELITFDEPVIFETRVGGVKTTEKFNTASEVADYFVKSFSDEALDFLERAEPGKSIQSLSRMWVPSGVTLKEPEQTRLMLGIAYNLINRSGTYDEFSEGMRMVTGALWGRTELASRAHGFGAAAVGLAGNMGHFNYMLQRAAVGVLEPKTAADMNRVLFGGAVEDIDSALAGFTQMGMPTTQQAVLSVQGIKPKMTQLIALGSSRGGEGALGKAVFVPKHVVDDLEKYAGDIVKETLARHPLARQIPIFGPAVMGHMSLWRQSVVTGLIVPNPRYWTNNMTGDMSQMWIESGLAPATARSFVNFFNNTPFIGRAFNDYALDMADKVGGRAGTRAALPSAVESMFNPWIGRVFKGEDGQFVAKNGRVYRFEDLRSWAAEDGILDTFVQEELLEVYVRKYRDPSNKFNQIFGPAASKLGDLQRDLVDHATLVQQRQRVGLYAHYLQQGMGRAEARKKVLNALYDWKHGLAEWEVNAITRMVPFYRFWRLAMKQIGDALIEPLVKPSWDHIGAAMTGNSKLARLRQQAVILPNLPDFLYATDPEGAMTAGEQIEEIGRYMHPRWMETRAKLGSWPIDPKRREFYAKMYGLDYTHETAVLPTFTGMDSLAMVHGMYAGLAGVYFKAAEMFGGQEAQGILTPDFESQFWEPMLSSLYPAVEVMFRRSLAGEGVDLEYLSRGAMRNLSGAEESIFYLTPLLREKGLMKLNPETGKWQVPNSVYTLYRNTPILAAQLPGFVRAGYSENPYVGDWGKWIATTLGKLSRFYDVRPYSAQREAEWRLKGIRKEGEAAVKKYGGDPGYDRVLKGPRTERLGEGRHEWEWKEDE